MTSLHKLFTTPVAPNVSDYEGHFEASEVYGDMYYLTYFTMQRSNHSLDTNCKVCVMLVAMNKKRMEVAEEILKSKYWTIHEMLALCRALDKRRRKRTLNTSCEKVIRRGVDAVHKTAVADLKRHNKQRTTSNLFHTRENRQGDDQFYSREKSTTQNKKTVFGGLRGQWNKPTYKSYFTPPANGPRSVRKSAYKYAHDTQENESLASMPTQELTLSGGRSVFINKWWSLQSVETLYRVLLESSFFPWKRTAELIHPNPTTMADPHFLKCIFSSKVQRPPTVEYCMRLRQDTLNDTSSLRRNKPPLTYLIKKFNLRSIGDKLRSMIAEYSPLHHVLKFYPSLAGFDVQEIIHQRLGMFLTRKEVQIIISVIIITNTEDEQDLIIRRSFGELVEYTWQAVKSKGGFLDKLISLVDTKIAMDPWWYDTPSLILCDDTISIEHRETAQTYAGLLSALTIGELYFVGESRSMMHEPASFKDALLLGFLCRCSTPVANYKHNLLSEFIKKCTAKKTYYKCITLFMSSSEEQQPLQEAIDEYKRLVNSCVKIIILVFGFGSPSTKSLPTGVVFYRHIHRGTPTSFDNVVATLRLCSENSDVLFTLSKTCKGLSLTAVAEQIETWSRANLVEVFTQILEDGEGDNPNKQADIVRNILPALKQAVHYKLISKIGKDCLAKGQYNEMLADSAWWDSPYQDKPSRSMVPLTGFTVIPPLVLDLILGYLSVPDLLTPARACRTWFASCIESSFDRTVVSHQEVQIPEFLIFQERGLISQYGKRRCYGALIKAGGNVDLAAATLLGGIKSTL